MKPRILSLWVLILPLLVVACQPTSPAGTAADGIRIMATTTIVGDIVRQVAGDQLQVDVLLPVNTDPHSFQPTPQDIARIADAAVVFANGAGLEEFLENLIEGADSAGKVIHLSDGLELLDFDDDHEDEDDDHEDGDDPDHEGFDPHVWTDPHNVKEWVRVFARELSTIDPDNAGTYQANADRYTSELDDLDAWIVEQVAEIPEANRVIVTDHQLFGYFAYRYGFEQAGTVIKGYSTLAAPSAQELAALEDTIRELNVRAIFVGTTVNPSLSQRVTEDTGTQLVYLYTGSLSEPGGPADTYLAYIRYNVSAIAAALK